MSPKCVRVSLAEARDHRAPPYVHPASARGGASFERAAAGPSLSGEEGGGAVCEGDSALRAVEEGAAVEGPAETEAEGGGEGRCCREAAALGGKSEENHWTEQEGKANKPPPPPTLGAAAPANAEKSQRQTTTNFSLTDAAASGERGTLTWEALSV